MFSGVKAKKYTLSALWNMNQGLITFIDQSDQLLMLSKHICASTFGINTFYEGILRLGQDWPRTYCEGVEYEQYVRVPQHYVNLFGKSWNVTDILIYVKSIFWSLVIDAEKRFSTFLLRRITVHFVAHHLHCRHIMKGGEITARKIHLSIFMLF